MEKPLIDKCPDCGEELQAMCEVVVSYTISNSGEDQDWERDEVFDDGSVPFEIRCPCCKKLWKHFELNDQGFLVGLD